MSAACKPYFILSLCLLLVSEGCWALQFLIHPEVVWIHPTRVDDGLQNHVLVWTACIELVLDGAVVESAMWATQLLAALPQDNIVWETRSGEREFHLELKGCGDRWKMVGSMKQKPASEVL